MEEAELGDLAQVEPRRELVSHEAGGAPQRRQRPLAHLPGLEHAHVDAGEREVRGDFDIGDAQDQTLEARVVELVLEDLGDLALHGLRDAFGPEFHWICSCQSMTSASGVP